MYLFLLGLIVFVLVLMMIVTHSKQVEWENKMRRSNAGSARRAEWLAPVNIMQQARTDYLEAWHWINNVTRNPVGQMANAVNYLSGDELVRFYGVSNAYRGNPRFYEYLKCEHEVTIRNFAALGDRCLAIDRQHARVMTIYDKKTGSARVSQRLDDAVFVYQLVYDRQRRRWKIEHFIQQMAGGVDAQSIYPPMPAPTSPKVGRNN